MYNQCNCWKNFGNSSIIPRTLDVLWVLIIISCSYQVWSVQDEGQDQMKFKEQSLNLWVGSFCIIDPLAFGSIFERFFGVIFDSSWDHIAARHIPLNIFLLIKTYCKCALVDQSWDFFSFNNLLVIFIIYLCYTSGLTKCISNIGVPRYYEVKERNEKYIIFAEN